MTKDDNPKLGIIGAGAIVRAHVDAAYRAGFTPKSICGRVLSPKAQQISQEFPTIEYCESLESLLETDIDALLIAVPPNESIEVLEKAITRGVPILIEKPVALTSAILRDFPKCDTSRVLVGFNRRHYSSVASFKSRALKLDAGLIKVDLPELSWSSQSNGNLRRKMLLENSVHVLDLINYIFGSIEPINVTKISDSDGTNFVALTFTTIRGFIGTLNLSYGTPENVSMKVWSNGLNIELSPLEIYTEFNSILAVPPSDEIPFKRYVKQSQGDWKISSNDQISKPGFIEQYLELKKLLSSDSGELISARLEDAEKALLLAEMLT